MVSRVLAATPPSVPEDGEGRMKALVSLARRAMRVLSANRFELAGAPRRRIDREDGDLAALLGEAVAQRVDQRRFADARCAGNAHAYGVAGPGQQRLDQRCGGVAVVTALTFDKRDSARQHGAVAAADIACEPFDIMGQGREAMRCQWRNEADGILHALGATPERQCFAAVI